MLQTWWNVYSGQNGLEHSYEQHTLQWQVVHLQAYRRRLHTLSLRTMEPDTPDAVVHLDHNAGTKTRRATPALLTCIYPHAPTRPCTPHARLHTCIPAPLHLSTVAPLHRCTAAPLHLCIPAPRTLCTSATPSNYTLRTPLPLCPGCGRWRRRRRGCSRRVAPKKTARRAPDLKNGDVRLSACTARRATRSRHTAHSRLWCEPRLRLLPSPTPNPFTSSRLPRPQPPPTPNYLLAFAPLGARDGARPHQACGARRCGATPLQRD